MRHRVKGKKLNRNTPHRKATLRALSAALIKEHRIKTTVAKAKALRTFVEPLITKAKVDNPHNRKQVFSSLQDKQAVKGLFEEVGPAAADRPGGYTRVLKLGYRAGDSAPMAVIELVDFNDIPPEQKTTKKKRTRRAGRSNKPTSVAEKPKEETKSEEAAAEAEENKKAEVAESVATEESADVEPSTDTEEVVDTAETAEDEDSSEEEEEKKD